jgi:hypothetical protein
MRARRLVGALACCAALGAAAAPSSLPATGRHTVQLCVATSAAPPSCGPAQADWRADGSLRLRVDDVVYNMRLRSSQVEIVVMHNVVQIDQLVVPYEWVGSTLQFSDDDRHSRYEIRFPPLMR